MTQLGENSVKGTEFKVRISMAPIDNRHMSDIEWECLVFTETSLKTLTINKQEAIKVDRDTYIIRIDSNVCGAGKYYVTLTAYIPDDDFIDGIRTEKRTAFTGVTIDAR